LEHGLGTGRRRGRLKPPKDLSSIGARAGGLKGILDLCRVAEFVTRERRCHDGNAVGIEAKRLSVQVQHRLAKQRRKCHEHERQPDLHDDEEALSCDTVRAAFIVATFRNADEPAISTIAGLDAGEPRRTDPRSVDLRQGIPIAAGAELWLGVAAKPDGSRGGLWRSADSGKTWQRVEQFASVNSIAIDPRDPTRVLVATAPGTIKSGVRELAVETALWERLGVDGSWKPLDHVPPFSPTSRVRFAGFFADGSLLIQVDSKVFELGRDNLARRSFGPVRRTVSPPEARRDQ
jgi:hypothetical protein